MIATEGAGQLDHAGWEAAFAEAAATMRDQVMTQATQWIEGAARESRCPSGQVRQAMPDGDAGEALLHRLLADAMPLERLSGEGNDPLSRRSRGAALEAAWDDADALAQGELRRWRQRAAALAAWRRPLAPFLATMAGLTVVLTVVSAWLGGQLTPPEWFRPVHSAFWSLPWP